MTYNLVKNKDKAQVSTTSMSGKYPDAIKCGSSFFHIRSVDDANSGVIYWSPVGTSVNEVIFRNGIFHARSGHLTDDCAG